MEYDGLEFPDAIEELASLHGMQVPVSKRRVDQAIANQPSARICSS